MVRSVELSPSVVTLEKRHIGYIPFLERYGKAWHLAPVWFNGNSNLLAFATAAIGISLGLNVAWTLVAAAIGLGVGALGMAYHSAQGPKLGLPQMVQSRAQFGYYGSIIPIAVAITIMVGFDVFAAVLSGQVLQATVQTSLALGEVIAVILMLGLTVVGYELIHRFSRWSTYMFIVVYGLLIIAIASSVHLPASSLSLTTSANGVAFLTAVGVFVSIQLTWEPYVSDYSRYLPKETKSSSTVFWTFLGSFVGGFWPTAVGAFVIAAAPTALTTDAIRSAGDHLFRGYGTVVLLLSLPSLIGGAAIGIYSGGLTLLSGVDLFAHLRAYRRDRIVAMVIVAIAVLVLTLAVPENFIPNFSAFLTFILYLIIPWGAINLTDFFMVRRGKYAIGDMFSPSGTYKRWSWRGLVAYIIGFSVMIPFFSVSFFTGPVAHALNGADISPFVGFPVAAILYYLLYRNVDLSSEQALAVRQEAELNSSQVSPAIAAL